MSVLETKQKNCQKGGELCDSSGGGKLSRQLTSVMSALTLLCFTADLIPAALRMRRICVQSH